MTEWNPLRPYENGTASEPESTATSRLLWKQLDQKAIERGRFIANTSPAKMPTLDHSSVADYANVYEPSDDTYLLIDAIKYDLFSGYPTTADRVTGTVTELEPSEEEIIDGAALELYHRQSRMRTNINDNDNDTKTNTEIEGDDGENERMQKEEHDVSQSQSRKIASRLQQLKRLKRIQTVMEIGTGSGVPITYLSKRLQLEKPPHSSSHGMNTNTANNVNNDDDDHDDQGFSLIATDLNPLALQFAERTAKENGILVGEAISGDKDDSSNEDSSGIEITRDKTASVRAKEFVECDLATPLLDRLEGSVDVLVFNPPYVPTDDVEICGSGIEISWAGGLDGRRVIDRALPQIARLLRQPDGACYMITVDDNLPRELACELRDEHGLRMVPLLRRRARNEYLSVQKISWL